MFTNVNFTSVVLAFEAIVSRFPDLCALRWREQSWTYSELNRRANRLAHCLLAAGVKQEAIVGVLSTRSPETLMALLAILKAGGAYLSLDPSYPKDRLEFYIKDAGIKLILAEAADAEILNSTGAKVITGFDEWAANYPDTNPPCYTTPDSASQVFYTSGSTGQPKGVVIEHRGALRLADCADWLDLGPGETVLQITPLNYDVSTFEIWATWLNGACLAVPAPGVSSLHDMGLALRNFNVSVVLLPTSLIPLMLEQEMESFKTVRQLVVGGDVLPPRCAEKFLERYPDSSLVNAYGPTENTVITTCHRIQLRKPTPARLSIGRPIKKTRVMILNDALKPVPPGEIGEIVITGDGLARGYLNQPQLTQRSFIQVTDASGASVRAYRSGDLGRFLPDGDLLFEGRIDEQVKINGIRIELGEVKSVLLSHPLVAEAEVLVVQKADVKRLEAFVVLKPGGVLEARDVREFLGKKIPANFLPSACRILPSLPRGPSGKVDRRVLLESVSESAPNEIDLQDEPQDALERVIWQVWKEIVPGVAFGRHDRFSELGADSLSALKVVAKVEALIGRPIGLKSLLVGGTIADMADAARQLGPVAQAPSMIQVQTGGVGREPFFFAHGDYTCGGLYCQRLARNLSPDQPFFAISPQGTFGEALPPSFEEAGASVLELVRSMQPKGPYYLGGYCNGALAMYEVAQQLSKSGETVKALILLDPPDLYFLELRQKVMAIGKWFGVHESRSRNLSSRIAEWIELYNAFGATHFVSEFFKRLRIKIPQYVTYYLRPHGLGPSDKGPNIDLHYYVVIADYAPGQYQGRDGVEVILREGEARYRPRQMAYWGKLIPQVKFTVVSGTHLEFQESLAQIGRFIQTVLTKTSSRRPDVTADQPST